MTKYESLYVISTKLDDEAIAAKVAKFKELAEANGAKEVTVDTEAWGKRKLAYAINYETEGYYVLMTFEGESELPRELERNFKNDENILRFSVTKAI